MPTFKLTVAYDGTDFVGWQIQPNGPTIQSELQSAIHAMTGQSVKVVGSGRTDSGVHAAGQVASFSLDHWPHDPSAFVDGLNAHLPDQIAVLDCQSVADRFHAIADCVGKRYRYQLQTAGPPDPMARRDRWRLKGEIDESALAAAARRIIGQRDYSSFEAAGAARQSSVRNITSCQYLSQTDPSGRRRWSCVEVAADGFLYNMVRNIVGTIVQVGRSKHPPSWVDDVIAARDRSVAGPTAPAHGLTLVEVFYGD